MGQRGILVSTAPSREGPASRPRDPLRLRLPFVVPPLELLLLPDAATAALAPAGGPCAPGEAHVLSRQLSASIDTDSWSCLSLPKAASIVSTIASQNAS